MNEFNTRARHWQEAKRCRELAAMAYDAERREQLLNEARMHERRARGYGTLKGKNRRGA